MTTQNKENYGRDVRSFHHPEDDMKPDSDITNQDLANESHEDQYERDHDDEEIVNQDDDIVNNEDDDELNNKFANTLETDNESEDENDFGTDNLKTDVLDLEYDLDQDLEETDPVNHPRNFNY